MALAYLRPWRPLQLDCTVTAAWRARTKARRCRCMRTAAWMTVAALLRRRCLASRRAAMPLAPACSHRVPTKVAAPCASTCRMTTVQVQATAAAQVSKAHQGGGH